MRSQRRLRRAGARSRAPSRSGRSTASTAATARVIDGGRRDRARRRRSITFDPHPAASCSATGSSCSRRSSGAWSCSRRPGSRTAIVVDVHAELAQLEPEEFVDATCSSDRDEVDRRGRGLPLRARRGAATSRCSSRLGFDVRRGAAVAGRLVDARSGALLHEGDVRGAAALLGRPPEVDGVGRRRRRSAAARSASRPRTSRVDPSLLVPALRHLRRRRRSATGRRSRSARTRTTAATSAAIEAYLLDFEGDLYGRRLVVELWERLRDERAFRRASRSSSTQIAARRRADAAPPSGPV